MHWTGSVDSAVRCECGNNMKWITPLPYWPSASPGADPEVDSIVTRDEGNGWTSGENSPFLFLFRFVTPKEEGFELRPDGGVSPVLAEDVSRIDLSVDVEELDHSRGNGFTDTVEGEGRVAFVQLAMGDGGGVDHSLVVTKHVGLVMDRNT